MAAFQLTYAVADWRESEKATLGEEAIKRMMWTTFRTRTLEKYFPIVERNNKRKKFLNFFSREYDCSRIHILIRAFVPFCL